MATTTNYGWTTPDDTALVKDGAAAIRTLGSSVDTTTKNLNPSTTLGDIEYRSSTANTNTRLGIGSTGQVLTVAGGVPTWATAGGGSGLTYVGGTTFSASSAVNVNNVFTSTYANYRIVCDYTASNTSALNVRLRVSGADNTTSNYQYQWINAGSTSVGAGRGNSQTSWSLPDKDTSGNTMDATIFNPQAALRTLMSETNISYSGEFWAASAFGFLATTSFDGFTLYPTSGNITGTVRVYGLANS